MSEKSVRTVAIVLLVVVAVAAAAGLSYFIQQRRVVALEADLKTKQADLAALKAKVDSITATLLSQTTSSSAAATDTAPSGPDASSDPKLPEKPEPTTLRQCAFVKKATNKNGKMSLVLDFAQFLTGSAAEDAAAAAGDETPPPNDYYISNTNPKLRTFPVARGAKFVVAYGDPNDTATLSADEFYDAIRHNSDGAADAVYWFVITNGTITGGEEQWLP